MKKYVLTSLSLVMIALSVLVISGCDSSSSDNPITPAATTGSIYVTSTPVGAQIWIDGTNSNKVTPDSVTSVSPGTHVVTLKLTNYKDATFNVAVTAGYQSKPDTYVMVSDVDLASFGPVRIYETTGTSASQPSGLCLSSGLAYGASSADKDKIDLVYFSNNTSTLYEIQSAKVYGLSRYTYFNPATSSILTDGVSSSVKSDAWYNAFSANDSTKYRFVYDNDKHYSKIKIVNYGGGTITTGAAWVDIKWIYNKKVDDVRFK